MLIFGHKFIESEKFYNISCIEDILKTPSSSLVLLVFKEKNLEIIKYLNQNSVLFALSVSNIEEVIYASSLNATYIIVEKELAKTAHDIAQNYLFDAKILVKLEENESLKSMALIGVDGVMFSSAVVKDSEFNKM